MAAKSKIRKPRHTDAQVVAALQQSGGIMYDDYLNGSVSGVINDGPMALDVNGEWTGKGQATLISIEPVNVYKVEVVE